MNLEDQILRLNENEKMNINYTFIQVFKNPNKLPITQIHLEKHSKELKKNLPKDINLEDLSDSEIENTYFEKKCEVIPALDKKWLPRTYFYIYQPYSLISDLEANNNLSSILVYHSFRTIKYLDDKYSKTYKAIYEKFHLLYERLLLFKQNEIEYMPESFGVSKLIEKKLLNLPIVITLGLLYKDVHLEFINRVSSIYFENSLHLDFIIKEVETTVDQNFIVLEMLHGYLLGDQNFNVTIPVSIEKRPLIFSLSWIYSLVNYILNTVATLNILFQIYKPAIEMTLNKDYPFKLPYIYVNVYKELYEILEDRDEISQEAELYKKVLKEMSLGRSELIDLYHVFISECVDKTLGNMGDTVTQQAIAEVYLKLMTTALEEDYFICDYNAIYNVANQNEMFQSCCDVDSTRTDFIVSCINKLPRKKKLEEYIKLGKNKINSDLKENVQTTPNSTDAVLNDLSGPSGTQNIINENDVEDRIRCILEMFPHLGDGFALKCLESYNFNSADVINAILENNLPPHILEIPFDQIRVPPEPEPEKPILAYKGKKPEYKDALTLLDDKNDKKEIKKLVLEGVQCGYDYMYDDEYDDRFDDDVAIQLPDNRLTEELPVKNPNRRDIELEEDSSSSEEEDDKAGSSRNTLNFCEDPAVIRERREARFRAKQGARAPPKANNSKSDVVGKPKGQGQDKSVVINRQRKNANKSSQANHNRKSGAQFKRNRGMLPS
ncbi:hypothetical protein GWI33_007994 [Rhynchophorus ferrugineus]|uniref:CUE domain-containing protein n=1 Tax=Rhynchophorus ferrugineus TaxID=354439 RepID=A0A834MEG9_RHYFE|nr:hypothetical protein GWI33_007994 [Rhynchophorus ferrugineus]